MNFACFNFEPRIERGLRAAGYDQTTPIQAAAIPAVLAGDDLIGTAQTGTGKTAAFVLPILHKLLGQEKRAGTRALIVTPTRELAEQIHEVIRTLGQFTPLRSATVYGGVGMPAQMQAFRRGVELIVACPGRLLDHLQRGNARLDQVETLVLDEADRMLDMGFLPSIREILKKVPANRQTLLFSATFPAGLERLVDQYLRHPKRISVDVEVPAGTVAHALYPVSQQMKPKLLLRVLEDLQTSSVLIFTRTKFRANRVSENLKRAGYEAAPLHANLNQNQRQRTLEQFRTRKLPILVATDIASRGLDIESISHVINYDMPDSATSYTHRIGRTGRAARTGDALTLTTWEDQDTVRNIERLLGAPIEKRILTGFPYDEPQPVQAAAPVPLTLRNRHTVTRNRRLSLCRGVRS